MKNEFIFLSQVHYVYANVIQSFAQYINLFVFPFREWTISTYHKSIQLMRQDNMSKVKFPYMLLDPTLALEIDETSKQHWRFPGAFHDHIAQTLYKPVIKDDNLYVTPLFLTLNLRMDLLAFFTSVYQKLDFETHALMKFGGYDRYVKPYQVIYDVPFPDVMEGDIDFQSYGFAKQVIPTIDENRYVLPVHTQPLIKLVSQSDASEKYGEDNLPVWRSTLSFEFKVHLLVGFYVKSPWKLQDLYLSYKTSELDMPNATIFEYVATSEIVEENDDYANKITFSDFVEIPPGAKDYVFEVDRDYTNTETFDIDLLTATPTFEEVIPLIPPDPSLYSYDDITKILSVSGPLYKGQHIHVALR